MVSLFLLLLRSKKLAVFTGVVGTAILGSFNSIAGENCDWEELIIYNGIKRQATFCVELATTYSERQLGLMFREDLEFNEGMIFVYNQPKPVSFWMKNTSIPLDIIFADDSGTVTSVLVPWNTCGATQSAVLGVATMTYLPFCFFNIISPLMTILYGYLGFKIKKIKS